MRSYLISTIIIAALLTACSSGAPEKNTAKSNVAANTMTAATNSANTTPNAQTLSEQKPVPVNVNSNAFNAAPDTNQQVIRVDPKNDKTTSGIYGRKAVDDSTFNAEMDAKGMMMEVRKFNNNPYIIKVERLFTTPNKTMKIYLKSGKTVQVPEEKLPNFSSAAPSEILIAAGVDLKQIQTNPGGSKVDDSVKKP